VINVYSAPLPLAPTSNNIPYGSREEIEKPVQKKV
jgi:hypothetical protein